MSLYKTLEIFGYSIFISDLTQINIEDKCSINTLNQYSYMIAENDPVFKESLINSDILLPDGVGIVAAVRLIKNKKIKKIAGYDLHLHLLQTLNNNSGKCFYLGSSEKTLLLIKERILKEYPNINARFNSPPFKAVFSDDENAEMIAKINEFKPNVVFVGMTAPKQEKWVYANKNRIDANVICSIGAVFDFYAGTIKRPSEFWINLGMEWIIRLKNEPKRMWRRYVYYGPIFLVKVLKEKLSKTV